MRFWLMLLLWTYHLVASASSRTVIYFDPSKIDDETSLLRIDWSQLAETALQLQSSRGEFGSTTPPTASLQTVPSLGMEVQVFAQTLKERLAVLLQQTLERHGRFIIQEDWVGKKYVIEEGLEFWHQLYQASTGEIDLHVINYFLTHQKMLAPDLPKTLYALFGTGIQIKQTILLDLNQVSVSERFQLWELARKFNFQLFHQGEYIILGRGNAFWILRNLLIKGERIETAAGRRRFQKNLHEFSRLQVPVRVSNLRPTAAAFYIPAWDPQLGLAFPTFVDFGAFVHETEHGRFNPFLRQLARHLQIKNYALPYQVDGPAIPNTFNDLPIKYGGYMNLLNEMNSFVAGDFLAPKIDYQRILRMVGGYKAQAGTEAAEGFGKIWNERRLASSSVPRLIRSEILALNQLNFDQVRELGKQALAGNDTVVKINYCRLLAKRYFQQELPAELAQMLLGVAQSAPSGDVLQEAQEAINATIFPLELRPMLQAVAELTSLPPKAWEWGMAFVDNGNLPLPKKVFDRDLVFAYLLSQIPQQPATLLSFKSWVLKSFGTTLVPENTWTSPVVQFLFDADGMRNQRLPEDYLRFVVDTYRGASTAQLLADLAVDPNPVTLYYLIHQRLADFQEAHLQQIFTQIMDENSSGAGRDAMFAIVNFLGQRDGIVNLKLASTDPKRLPGTASLLLSEGIDQTIHDLLFNRPYNAQSALLINWLRSYTYPSEFPKTFERVKNIFINLETLGESHYLEYFNLFLRDLGQGTSGHLAWEKELVLQFYRHGVHHHLGMIWIATYHYWRNLGPYLFTKEWGNYGASSDGNFIRTSVQTEIEQLDQEKQIIFRNAQEHLWQMFEQNDYVEAKLAAIYAFTSYPQYLLSLEERLQKMLLSFDQEIQWLGAVKLFSMLPSGLFPQLDDLVVSDQFRSQLRPLQQELFANRLNKTKAVNCVQLARIIFGM